MKINKTELPKGWKVSNLGDVCANISSGRNKHKFIDGEFPVYGSTGIIGYTDEYKYDIYSILIARVGANAGQVNIASATKYDVSDNTLVLTLKPNIIFDFIYSLLIYLNINKLVFGSGQPLITSGSLKSLKIPVPPIGEQERIAELLSCWDKAIEENLKIIALKEKRKKAIMQSLLSGKFRLKGFSSPWKIIKFSDVFARVDRKNKVNNENVLTISAQNGFISQGEFFNKNVAGKNLEKYLLLKQGEFGYNRSYSKGYPMGAIKRLERYEMGVVSTLYICFSAQNINPIFASHYFESGLFNKEIYKIAQEGARNHGLLNVALGDFFKSRLLLPTSIQEQEKIAEILSVVDEEISLFKGKVELLKKQKKYLMQVLLSGKKRLKG